MKKFITFLPILFVLLFAACEEEGPKPAEVGELETYTDEASKFQIDYPSNWETARAIGKQFQAFSDSKGKKRFTQYDTDGAPIARISLTLVTLDSGQTLQKALDTSMVFAPEVYSAPVDVKIDGASGKKVTYSFPLSDGEFNGELIVAKNDELAHIIKYEAFAGTMENYKETFDKITSNIKLGTKPEMTVDTVGGEELPPPSSTLKTVSGDGYSIRIPENFNVKDEGNRTVYIGERRGDSYVSVDKSKMSSKNLKGTAERSAKAVGVKSVDKITLGGQEAYRISYEPKTIHRDIYMTIVDGNLYRVIVDYSKEESDLYKDILTKSARSISFN